MKKCYIVVLLFLIITIISCSASAQTDIVKSKTKYILTNSVGMNFQQSRAAYYISFMRKLNEKIFLGLRFGTYNRKKNIDTVVRNLVIDNRTFEKGYWGGENYVTINQNPWIISLQSGYYQTKNISVLISLGAQNIPIREYPKVIYTFESNGQTVSNFKYNLGQDVNKKTIIKLYFSGGVEYDLDNFRIGVYADNIFSAGLSAGFNF